MSTDTENEMISHVEIPVDGSDFVHAGLTKYGKHVLRNHFPQGVDGLKSLYRRIMWTARKWPDTGQGGTGAVGQVKELHDHGDDSIYGTIGRMAQEFQFSPPLIIFHGSKGSYTGGSPAASRYTGISMHPFAREVFFKGIEVDAIPMMQGMDLQVYEPQYLAPAIPLALVLGNTTVGYGLGSKLPARNLSDICDLVEAYCAHLSAGGTYSNFDICKHAEKLLPDFPLENIITNRDELLTAYRAGNFDMKIDLEGIVTLARHYIRVHTLPVGRGFDVSDKIRAAIDDAKSRNGGKAANRWIEQNVVDARDDPKCVTIYLKKNSTSTFEVWEHIKRLIGYSDTFHPNPNYVDGDGLIYRLSPLNILEIWYKKRHDLLLSSKRRQLRRLFEQVRITEALLIISQHTDKVIQIIRKHDPQDAIMSLVKTFGLTEFQAGHLVSAKLSTLSKTSKDELEQQYADQKARVNELQASFGKIPQEIASMAQDIKRRYGRDRISKMPNYIGYVSVQGGCIQFDSTAEVEKVLDNFPGIPLSVHTYDGPYLLQVEQDSRWQSGSVSKYTTGDIYGLPFHGSGGYTVNIKGKAGCCVKGIIPGLRSEGYCYTTKKSWVLHRNGKIRAVDITEEISMRKSIGRGSNTNIVHVYPHTNKAHYVIVACDMDQNNLILQRVTGDDTGMKLPPAGNIHAIHHYTGKDWYFTLPEGYTNRVNARVFHITNAEALLEGSDAVRIDLGQGKWKRSGVLKYLT